MRRPRRPERQLERPVSVHQAYLRTILAQNSANSAGSLGGDVWSSRTPSEPGVKQNVSVTSNPSSARICRSNQASAPGRWLSAH